MADYSRYKKYDDEWINSLPLEDRIDPELHNLIRRRNHLAYPERGLMQGQPYWSTPSLDSGNINPAYVKQAGIVPTGILGGGIEETNINEAGQPIYDHSMTLNKTAPPIQPRVNPNVSIPTPMVNTQPRVNVPNDPRTPPRVVREGREEWQFDPSWQGIKNASRGLLGEAKSLFTDPNRMAMIRGGLALMDPSTYYDRQGFYSPMGGLNRAIGQASDTYQSLRKPFRDQEFKLQNTRLTNLAPTNLTKEYNSFLLKTKRCLMSNANMKQKMLS